MDGLLMLILFRLFIRANELSTRRRRIESMKQRIWMMRRRISRRKLERVMCILALLSLPAISSPRRAWSLPRLVMKCHLLKMCIQYACIVSAISYFYNIAHMTIAAKPYSI